MGNVWWNSATQMCATTHSVMQTGGLKADIRN